MKTAKKKPTVSTDLLTEEQKHIADFLEKLSFRRTLFGVDPEEVWQKLDELNALYEKMLLAERASSRAEIERLRAALQKEGGESDP